VNDREQNPVRIAEGPLVYLPREEVGLLDLALVLVRQRGWLLFGIAVVLGWTGWNYLRSPVRYESRAVVRIGRSRSSFPIKPTKEQQDMLLEPVPVAALRVREEFAPGSELSQKHQGTYVSRTVFDKEADELLTIFARGPNPKATRDFLQQVAEDCVAKHRSLFAPARQAMDSRLKQIADQRLLLQQELNGLQIPPDDQPAAIAISRLTRAQLLQQQLELDQETVRLQRDLADLHSQPTEVLVAASIPGVAVEPNLKWAFVLGVCGAVLVGVACAFIADFVSVLIRRSQSASPRASA